MTKMRTAIYALAMALPWLALAQDRQAEPSRTPAATQDSAQKPLAPMDVQVLAKVHQANQMEKEQMQKQMAMAEKLKSLSGEEFDRSFTTAMVQAHEQAIQMLEMARGQVEDPKLRSMLGKMIPVLKEHLSIAQRLSRNAGAPS